MRAVDRTSTRRDLGCLMPEMLRGLGFGMVRGRERGLVSRGMDWLDDGLDMLGEPVREPTVEAGFMASGPDFGFTPKLSESRADLGAGGADGGSSSSSSNSSSE